MNITSQMVDVQGWLEQVASVGVPRGVSIGRSPLGKRSANIMAPAGPPSPKKRKAESGHAESDLDVTPRASAQAVHLGQGAGSLGSDGTSRSSTPRRSQSPTKRLLAMTRNRVTTRQMLFSDDDALPQALAEFHREMESVGEHEGVIDAGHKAFIDTQRGRGFLAIKESMYCATGKRGSLGSTPSVAFVQKMVSRARECTLRRDCEAGWNCAVHYPLLEKALRDVPHINFVNCTTARITNEYRPQNAQALTAMSKMVDFAVYREITREERDVVERVNPLVDSMPLNSINQTSMGAVEGQPICVSVETKSGMEHGVEAALQMSVWLTAQFSVLEYMAARSGGAHLDRLPFLPAVIVQGHEWKFVAATRDRGEVCVWGETTFGTTAHVRGVYSIICGLQMLADWSKRVYWPWFARELLDLPQT